MKEFKIGDVVRLKTDGPGKLSLTLKCFDATDGTVLCKSECSRRTTWVETRELELVHRPDPQADIKQAIRDVLLSDEFMTAFAAAFRSEAVSQYTFSDEVRSFEHPIPGVNRPMRSRNPLADGLVGVWVPNASAKAPWTPKVGDWVKVAKPVDCAPAHKIWWVEEMNIFDGKVMRVTSVCEQAPLAILDTQFAWEFDFAWLAPAEDPRGQPEPKHRTPTAEDLKNGPIECEVKDYDHHEWSKARLTSIGLPTDYIFRFVAKKPDSQILDRYAQCRIEAAE
jgi:uncharacterized protein YodC (DUF2158 family)